MKNWADNIVLNDMKIKKNAKLVVIDDIVCTSAAFLAIDSIIHGANARVIKYLCIKNMSDKNAIKGVTIKSLV